MNLNLHLAHNACLTSRFLLATFLRVIAKKVTAENCPVQALVSFGYDEQ